MKNYRDEFNRESRDFRWTAWKVFGIALGIIVVLSVTSYIFGWFGEAGKVAQDEFGPKAALAKYEWFINQANHIKKARTDIEVFEKRVQAVDVQYKSYGEDHSKWPPHIQVQYNTAKQTARDDLTAIMSNHNRLVKEYNAESEKFNWAPFNTYKDRPAERIDEYRIPDL